MKKKNAAFTLIELLVVIAIIAVLATLAIPNILGALETAKSSTDVANLSSLGKGLQRYLIENEDDFFPNAAAVPWPQSINKFLNDWRAFQSPFDKRPPANTSPYPVSYAINQNCFDTNSSQWTGSSQLLVMAPNKQTEKGPGAFQGLSTSVPRLNPGQGYGTHKGGKLINCLFGDYHAVAITMTDYRDTKSIKGRQRWTPIPQN